MGGKYIAARSMYVACTKAKLIVAEFALQGYLTSLFGNVLLLGCFVDKGEGGATAVQAIGAVANYAMLGQAGAY